MSDSTPDEPELTPDELLARAGRLVRQRRIEMGLTQQALAARAKVGTMTLVKLEKGQQDSYRDMTLGQISEALLWPFDAIERLLAGDSDPDPLRTAVEGTSHAAPEVAQILQELIAQVVEVEKRLSRVEASLEQGGR